MKKRKTYKYCVHVISAYADVVRQIYPKNDVHLCIADVLETILVKVR